MDSANARDARTLNPFAKVPDVDEETNPVALTNHIRLRNNIERKSIYIHTSFNLIII